MQKWQGELQSYYAIVFDCSLTLVFGVWSFGELIESLLAQQGMSCGHGRVLTWKKKTHKVYSLGHPLNYSEGEE